MMRTALRNSKYGWGQRVMASVPLFNDGSLPQCGKKALVVQQGTMGEIVSVVPDKREKAPVYAVAFQDGLVVGCLETELVSA